MKDTNRTSRGLVTRLYEQLKEIARCYLSHDRVGQFLDPTELVHTVFGRFGATSRVWESESAFTTAFSRKMRHRMIDLARGLSTGKRGNWSPHVSFEDHVTTRFDDDWVYYEAALRQLLLEKHGARRKRVMELWAARLRQEEIAEVVGVSVDTVQRDIKFSRDWLRTRAQELKQSISGGSEITGR